MCHDETENIHHNKCDRYRSQSDVTFNIPTMSINTMAGIGGQWKRRKNHLRPSYSKRREKRHRPSSQHHPCDEQLQHTLNEFPINDMSNG